MKNQIDQDSITTCSIPNSGIISIQQQCIIQTEKLELAADYIYDRDQPVVINPSLNVSSILEVVQGFDNYDNNSFPTYNISEDLETLRTYADQQRNDMNKPDFDTYEY